MDPKCVVVVAPRCCGVPPPPPPPSCACGAVVPYGEELLNISLLLKESVLSLSLKTRDFFLEDLSLSFFCSQV